MLQMVWLGSEPKIIDTKSALWKNEKFGLKIDDSRKTNVERAIFYNIFVPKHTNNQRLKSGSDPKENYALGLVEEQLKYFRSASEFVQRSSIHYTLIGDIKVSEDIDRLCNDAFGTNGDETKCHQLRAIEEGDEGLTLESVYDYCGEHPKAQVTYLHNKGSFHPSPHNTAMRRLLTKGVFSDECQAMPTGECTVCASRFSPLPHTHMSGNMWTADCSYIQKLIRPSEFASRMDAMVEHSLALNDESIFPKPGRKYLERPYDYGLNRFSFEYWVGSHPALKPCDVYPNSEYAYGFANLDASEAAISAKESGWKPILRKVPWIPLERFWHWSFNEWFCGRGRLAQYKFLYGEYPDADSFFWPYYDKPVKKPFKNFYSFLDRGCPTPIKQSDYLERPSL